MKIIVLDQITIGNDLNYSELSKYGEVILNSNCNTEEMLDFVKDADVLVGNKIKFNEQTLRTAEHLKLICVTGTGYNNVDIAYAKKHEIGVCNIPAYSIDSVTQHTFALLFQYMEKINEYDQCVRERSYIGKDVFGLVSTHFFELRNKVWGIIGLGNIGKRVAEIASCFGCKVIYYSTSGKNNNSTYQQVSLDTLLAESDIISIHAPMNDTTRNLLTFAEFQKMKKTACILNVGRGGIANEEDLVRAVEEDIIAGACIDVFEEEPIKENSPYLTEKVKSNIVLTPHIAWGAVESRQRAIDVTAANIHAFICGENLNRVV